MMCDVMKLTVCPFVLFVLSSLNTIVPSDVDYLVCAGRLAC